MDLKHNNMLNSFIIDKLKFYININRGKSKFINLTYGDNVKLKKIQNEYKSIASIKISWNKLSITICPRKFLYHTNDNLYGLTLEEFKECLSKLQCLISEIEEALEIKAEHSIENAVITGIDLTKNIETEHLFHCYIPVFESIRPRQNLYYVKYRNTYEVDYNTVYFRSKKRTDNSYRLNIKIYNKVKELESRKVFIPIDLQGKNIMRFELSLINSKCIQDKLGIKTINDILNKGFTYLEDKRDEIIQEYLFHETLTEDIKCLNSLDDIDLAKKLKESSNKNNVLNYLIISGLEKIKYNYHKEVLISAGYTESNIDDQFKKVKTYIRQHKKHRNIEEPTIASLYKEIYMKYLKDSILTIKSKEVA